MRKYIMCDGFVHDIDDLQDKILNALRNSWSSSKELLQDLQMEPSVNSVMVGDASVDEYLLAGAIEVPSLKSNPDVRVVTENDIIKTVDVRVDIGHCELSFIFKPEEIWG